MSAGPRVTVVGSSMVDLISYLVRMPDLGETVFGRHFAQGFGGKGANQAVMAALLGAEVAMVNAVGSDSFGRDTIDNFRSFDIDVRHMRVIDGLYSGVANVMVEPSGDNRIVLGAGANEHVSEQQVEAAFADLPAPAVVVSQLEIPQAPIRRGFELAKEQGAVTVLNPGPAAPVDPAILALTDWLIPNESEFDLLARAALQDLSEDRMEAVQAFAQRLEVNVIVTLGEQGAALFRPGADTSVARFPAPRVEVADTTGAGDAFVGAFAYALAANHPAADAITLANLLAADSVTRPGTQISYARDERLDRLRSQVTPPPARALTGIA